MIGWRELRLWSESEGEVGLSWVIVELQVKVVVFDVVRTRAVARFAGECGPCEGRTSSMVRRRRVIQGGLRILLWVKEVYNL